MELGSRRDFIGKCGIYCGACRLYVLKKCEGCFNEETECPYYKCVENKGINPCGECQEFPCKNIMVQWQYTQKTSWLEKTRNKQNPTMTVSSAKNVNKWEKEFAEQTLTKFRIA